MDFPKRRLPRLQGYDYSAQGFYYVTICSPEKKNIFGCAGNGLDRSAVQLSIFGKIAQEELLKIPERFEAVSVDDYIIMPNHIHCVIQIGCKSSERSRPFPTLSEIIGLYKSGVTGRIHTETEMQSQIWQKSYYDTVISSEAQYLSIREHITYNPVKWRQGKGTDY